MNNSIHYHKFDLPADHGLKGDLACDTETMGLNTRRDRLCMVQLADESGAAHLVHFPEANYKAPNLRALLARKNTTFLYHFARFDLAALHFYLDSMTEKVFCSKIASRLARTYTDRHGLKDLVRELVDHEIDKSKQTSNWGADNLSEAQLIYAAEDVLYLHKSRDALVKMLKESNRLELAEKCFAFLPARAKLDLEGWSDTDIFAHSQPKS